MTTVCQYNIFSSISWNFKMSHVLTFPDATNIIFGSNCLYFTMDGWMDGERLEPVTAAVRCGARIRMILKVHSGSTTLRNTTTFI